MEDMDWFKFYGAEYLSDPKVTSLSPSERSCWLSLLCFASVAEDDGRIKYLTEERLMVSAGLDVTSDNWENTVGVLKKFLELEMITLDNDVITIKNWKKRQGSSLTSYERVKRFREKKRNDNEVITRETQNDNDRREENRIDTTSEAPLRVVSDFDEDEQPQKPKRDTSYRAVFELWGKYPLNWKQNRTEVAAAKNLLSEHGLEHARMALEYARTHANDEMCPQILKPSDLDRKWVNLQAFRDR